MVKVTLKDRIFRYLQNNQRWVGKIELTKKAQAKGYSWDSIQNALKEAEKDVAVGTIFVSEDTQDLKRGQYYFLHPMTSEEKKAIENALLWFEEL